MLTLIGGITFGGGVELIACFGNYTKSFVKKFRQSLLFFIVGC
jgi:hypothetical protein